MMRVADWAVWFIGAALTCWPAAAYVQEVAGVADQRIRSVDYSAGSVYRLRGYIGYQIDLEFESGEAFVGLGAGDVAGLAFAAQHNHLFIKPRMAGVHTNITVLTTRRAYRFEYETVAGGPESDPTTVIYALRFRYQPSSAGAQPTAADAMERKLDGDAGQVATNRDYWYCGPSALKPLEVEDDGVHTRLRFDPRTELPALFVRDEDGSEALLNFNVEHGDVIVHRIARQFVLRRGGLVGCVVNRGFPASARGVASGTVAPTIERATRAAAP
jgi:type IV secretion system protein VirB9